VRLTAANALDRLHGYDLLIDATDNFPARYLLSDASVLLGVPNVHGSVLRFEGRVVLLGAADGPCYRCLFPVPPPPELIPDCADAGVLGVLPGLIGALQAAEAIKWLTGAGASAGGHLLVVDALRLRFHPVTVHRDPACPACGTRELRTLVDYDAFCGVRRSAADIRRLTPGEVALRLRAPEVQLIDVREPWEYAISRLPDALLIPMEQLDAQLPTLDRTRETIVYCHHGARSLVAARRLAAAGFTDVAHLEGGIERWSREIDSSTARY
jgi:adenylyltransferase/sulfurtransferase